MVGVGVWLPTRGALSIDPGVAQIARNAEASGFDSLMIPDHVVMPSVIRSRYPFSADGVPSWDPRTPWNDTIVAMAICAAVTTRVEIGAGVLILPQRHPVILAKQLASIDVASGGRVMLGIGAGWLAEEFDALGVPFATRGRRMDEWLHLLREIWTGEPASFEGEHYTLPEGVLAYPTPARRIPIVVGGMSKAALRRASETDGWYAIQRTDALDVDEISAGTARIAGQRGDHVRPRVILRVIGDIRHLLAHVPDFVRAGVTDFVVDTDLTDVAVARAAMSAVRDAAGAP